MDNKKKKKSGVLGMILGFLLGAALGVGLVIYMELTIPADLSFGQYMGRMMLMLLLFYSTFILQIIIHEAGHLIFGLASGYEFVSFRIFSLQLTRTNGKLKLGRHSIAGTAGQCLMSPPDLVDGKMPVMLYNLGGALINLLSAAVCAALYAVLDRESLFSFFCLFMSLFGLVSALTNGIPMRMANVDNDGYNALSLGKDKDAMRGLWLQLKINAKLSNGKRLQELPDEWFVLPSDEAMRNSMVAPIGVFACNRLMDQNRYKEAAQLAKYLLKIDSGIAGVHRHMLTCDLMCCEMIEDNRREIIEELNTKELQNFMKAMKTSSSVTRTQYIYALLVSSDLKEASSLMKRFEKIKTNHPYPRDILCDCEIMKAAQHKAEREGITYG